MISIAVIIILSYLAGSLPTSIIAGKVLKGIDIREHGSGNAGATNVLRVLGWKAASVMGIIDLLKGFVATVYISGIAFGDVPVSHDIVRIAAGLSAVIGHIWTVFSGFKGGRGVMTGWGAMIVLSPIAAGVTALGWIVVTVTRYVSVGSLVGTVLGAIAMIVLGMLELVPMEYILFSIPGAIVIFVRHFENIGRLASGSEEPVTEPGRPTRARTRHS